MSELTRIIIVKGNPSKDRLLPVHKAKERYTNGDLVWCEDAQKYCLNHNRFKRLPRFLKEAEGVTS